MKISERCGEPLVSADAASTPAEAVPLTFRILRTISEVEELRPVWSAWEGHPQSDIDFLLMLLQCREEILNPYVIVVYRGGEPDAMLIGRLERRQVKYRVGYLPIFKVEARGLSFQYGGLRGNPSDENSKEIVLAILRSLKSGEADLATLDHPGTDSYLYKRGLSLPSLLSRDYFPVPQPHHLMRLSGTIDEVFLGLSNSHRAGLRYDIKKIEKKLHGRVKICCFREFAELETAISYVEEVARKTYHRGLGVGFDDSPRTRQMLQFYARNGQLRMYVLFDASTPIAFWIGVVYGGWFYSDHTGFDPQYRGYSPGTYLLSKMIEDFCKESLLGIDFGLGDAQYKQRFGNYSFKEVSLHLCAPSWKGFMLNLFRTGTIIIDTGLKKILERTKLLPKIKKIWRDRLARGNASN